MSLLNWEKNRKIEAKTLKIFLKKWQSSFAIPSHSELQWTRVKLKSELIDLLEA